MTELQPCPCGKTPTELHVDSAGVKWAFASGNCCNEWHIEFRNQYAQEYEQIHKLANEAWNRTPRA